MLYQNNQLKPRPKTPDKALTRPEKKPFSPPIAGNIAQMDLSPDAPRGRDVTGRPLPDLNAINAQPTPRLTMPQKSLTPEQLRDTAAQSRIASDRDRRSTALGEAKLKLEEMEAKASLDQMTEDLAKRKKEKDEAARKLMSDLPAMRLGGTTGPT